MDASKFDSGNGTVILSEDGTLTWLEPEVVVEFIKQDEDGNTLAGAKLNVTDEDGNTVVDEWTSTEDAYIVTGVFEVGNTYYLNEKSAPEGYDVADPVRFTVSDDSVSPNEDKVVTVRMTDKKRSITTTDKSNKSVKTGDNMPIGFALTLIMLSVIMMIAESVVFIRKSRK